MRRIGIPTTTVGAVVAVLLLAAATSPFWTVLVVKRHAVQIVDDSLRGLSTSSLAGVNISDGFVELALAIASADENVLERSSKEIALNSRQTDIQLDAYVTTVSNADEQNDLIQVNERKKAYRETRARVLELLRQGKRADAVALYQSTTLAQFVAYKQAIDRVVQANEAETRKQGASIIRLCNFLLVLQGLLLIFFFVYAFFVPLVTIMERTTIRSDEVKDL